MNDNILHHVRLRQCLSAVAAMLSGCETRKEACLFLVGLEMEISKLAGGGIDSMCYEQAIADFDGPQSYGLERIGFWPASKENEIE